MGRDTNIKKDTEIDVSMGADIAIPYLVESWGQGFLSALITVHSQHLEPTCSGLNAHLCSPGAWRFPSLGCTLPLSCHLLSSVSLPHCTSRSLRILRQVHKPLILQRFCIFPHVIDTLYTSTKYRCGRSIPEETERYKKMVIRCNSHDSLSHSVMSLHKCHLRSEVFLDVPI